MAKLSLPAHRQWVTIPSVYLITAMVKSTVQIIYFFFFFLSGSILIVFTSLGSTVIKSLYSRKSFSKEDKNQISQLC